MSMDKILNEWKQQEENIRQFIKQKDIYHALEEYGRYCQDRICKSEMRDAITEGFPAKEYFTEYVYFLYTRLGLIERDDWCLHCRLELEDKFEWEDLKKLLLNTILTVIKRAGVNMLFKMEIPYFTLGHCETMEMLSEFAKKLTHTKIMKRSKRRKSSYIPDKDVLLDQEFIDFFVSRDMKQEYFSLLGELGYVSNSIELVNKIT